ncbi:MAG: DNA-binding response regulator [Haliscomenobacteraceae bacterium CHB4]|nr:DNA-binding response regulator [Haliscomenobacteraceae bacterium CHB4]
MTCILIDDEPDCLDLLALLIRKHCPTLQIIGQYGDPHEAIAAIQTMRPNLVLLDVEMPEINGFGVLEACRDIPFQVIFTTAFNEYAVKAFKYSAIGYLLKPVGQEELVDAVQRAQQVLSIQHLVQQRDILFDYLHPARPVREKIALATSTEVVFIPVNDIIYCEADGNYTQIYRHSQKTPALFTKPLKEIEELLPADLFYRVHHSFIINLKRVEAYIRGDNGGVRMCNGTLVPVARARKQELLILLDKI